MPYTILCVKLSLNASWGKKIKNLLLRGARKLAGSISAIITLME